MRLTRQGPFLIGKNGDVWFNNLRRAEYLSDLIAGFHNTGEEGIIRVTMIRDRPLYLSGYNDHNIKDTIFSKRIMEPINLTDQGEVCIGDPAGCAGHITILDTEVNWIDNFHVSSSRAVILIIKDNLLILLNVNKDADIITSEVRWSMTISDIIPEGIRSIEEGITHSNSGRIFYIKEDNNCYHLVHLEGFRDAIKIGSKLYAITEDGWLMRINQSNRTIIDKKIMFTRFISAYEADIEHFELKPQRRYCDGTRGIQGRDGCDGKLGRDSTRGMDRRVRVDNIVLFLEAENNNIYAVKDNKIVQVKLPVDPLNPLIISKPVKSAATRI